ncbi:TIGR02569 family protein, partial [Kibdelosporangium lantanae]
MDLPVDVRTAFGLSGETAVRLPGGAGVCWQVGDVVCKPGQSTVVASWLAELYAELDGPGFTVAR